MTRPAVSVVMPFAGDRSAAQAAVASLRSLDVRVGDQLILVDNAGDGVVGGVELGAPKPSVTVITASEEHSPAHARNAGAASAANDWILFLDADTAPRPGLIAALFEGGIDAGVGAVAGEVLPAADGTSLAARYGAARSFLGQQAHYDHPYRPRAAAANLLVRRSVFEQLGGFYEGVRAGEDTDFSWRLQEAGWRLELRPRAAVEHRYRASVAQLRRQWRGYAAGRAWLARRHEGFRPEPAAMRALRRIRRRGLGELRPASGDGIPAARWETGRFLGLDVLLGVEELRGLVLSNRPRAGRRPGRLPVFTGRSARRETHAAEVVLIADRFPVRGDPLVELAHTVGRVRVEAVARPLDPAPWPARGIPVDYLEDDGTAERWAALLALLLRHPLRSALDVVGRSPDAPPLRALAPAVGRLERDGGARLLALHDHATAQRLARLAGRSLDR